VIEDDDERDHCRIVEGEGRRTKLFPRRAACVEVGLMEMMQHMRTQFLIWKVVSRGWTALVVAGVRTSRR
jgi:hypothetical protein